MKNLNSTQNNKINQIEDSEFKPSFEMSVYNEMLDQTAHSVDVLKMIQDQFTELNQISHKRSFLIKEISQYMKS